LFIFFFALIILAGEALCWTWGVRHGTNLLVQVLYWIQIFF